MINEASLRKFRSRFNDGIPKNILNLLYERKEYQLSLDHEVGRELCYDLFFLLSQSIRSAPSEIDTEQQLKDFNEQVSMLHKISNRVCCVIKSHKVVKHEDGRDFFSKEEWYALFNRTTHEKFAKERRSIEIGRSFYTAYKTPMGADIEVHMQEQIQRGFQHLAYGNITLSSLYELRVYRVIQNIWEKRKYDYKTNIERVRKIIYKG